MIDALQVPDIAQFKETFRSSEILAVAARLFYEHGFSNVSTRAVAEEVGVLGASVRPNTSGK